MTPLPAGFMAAFGVLLGNEGGFTDDPKDSGNWTGGIVDKGALVGTNWGVSAASYPTLDIKHLTRDQAASIYYVSYWLKAKCDLLPAPLALLTFDAAVNNGAGRAVAWLQIAVGAKADGAFGPASAAALQKALGNGSPDRVTALCIAFHTERILFMAALDTWRTYGRGWTRRLVRMPFLAGQMQANPTPTAAA